MAQSTFLWEGAPAKVSRWQGEERAWMIHVLAWPENMSGSFLASLRAGSSSKTSAALEMPNTPQISKPSLRRFEKSAISDASGVWTLATSASRSDAIECSLSSILETGDHLRRYCLSQTACAGILRRAAKRGKTLPEALRLALEAAAGSEPTSK